MSKAVGRMALAGIAATVGAVVFAGAASAATSHGTAPAGTTLNYTLDFTNTTFSPTTDTVGSGFVGSGTLADKDGNNVGTVVDTCYEVGDTNNDPQVSCTVDLMPKDGDIQVSTVGTIDPNKADYPYSFPGIVNGGTGTYDGAAGDATFTATAPATYTLEVDLK